MKALTFDLSKDGLSLDTTNGELLLFTTTASLKLKMDLPSKLIINNDVSLCIKNQMLSLKGLSKFEFMPVNKVDSLNIKETTPVKEITTNKSRYAFKPHRHTNKVLQVCSKDYLTRDEIFAKILDEEEYKMFCDLHKYERSYRYYRPLLWSLVTAGYLKTMGAENRDAKTIFFQTTEEGLSYLKGS